MGRDRSLRRRSVDMLMKGLTLLAIIVAIGRGDSQGILVKADDPPNKDIDKLQGTWQVLSGEENGKPMKKDQIDEISYEFRGDSLIIKHMGIALGASEIKLNVAKKPKEMDILVGSNGINPAIYEIDGDKLKICMDKPDGIRPTQFKTKADTAQKMFEFKRMKKQ
jgi:uncharacterized protein (TIGR03067 family)